MLTLAERGCMVASHNALRHLQAEPANVTDTIGAGDAFMSGLIYEAISFGAARQLTAKESEEKLIDLCAQTALRSAAITVSRAGANPPNCLDLNGYANSYRGGTPIRELTPSSGGTPGRIHAET